MNRLLRLTCPLLTGILGGAAFLHAAPATAVPAQPGTAAATTPADDAALDRELNALIASVEPEWTSSASVSTAVGYKHNLLLSPSSPADSPFARAGFETLLWHVPRGRIDYFGFANGEYTRYTKKDTDSFGQSVDHESQAFAGLEWRYRDGDRFTFSIDPQGYYLDQIFDVSDTVGRTSIEELKVTGGKIGPTLRWSPWPWLWLETNGSVERQKFQDGLNDDRIREATLRLGWKPFDRLELAVAGTQRRRGFDRRAPITADGPQPGLLVIHQREVRGRATIEWGRSRHWKTVSHFGVLDYTDNAAGYLNYRRRRVAQEIDWAAGRWAVRAEADARRKDYRSQTVGAGISPPKLVKDEYMAQVRLERKLSDTWTTFTEFKWERSRSNDPIASYRMNEGLLGLRWSWEK